MSVASADRGSVVVVVGAAVVAGVDVVLVAIVSTGVGVTSDSPPSLEVPQLAMTTREASTSPERFVMAADYSAGEIATRSPRLSDSNSVIVTPSVVRY